MITINNRKFITFEDDLTEAFKDPEFKKEWDKLEPEYQLAKQLHEKREQQKLSQRDLAKKMKTSQAAVARIESGDGNPTLNTLKNVAQALGNKLEIKFSPSHTAPVA
ncbi:helix-turn-helix domain-containing protein [Patescibacteria group bacterium]|nr:helix-turn-helix domain-containing protein [Patescibacteria group bacterium]MBU1885605.1 helix-turn-helix domain-containing protein [Patescibacteria group bacterium]